MSQTLLIETNEQRRKLYSLNLNIFVGTDVVSKNNHQEAINLLKVHPAVDLIICPNHIESVNTANEIYYFLQKEVRKIPIMALGKDDRQQSGIYYIDKNPENNIKQFVGEVAKTLGVTAKDLLDRPVPALFPIPINYFLSLENAYCDLYLRVRKNDGEDRYLKRFIAGDLLSKWALLRYIAYGESQLFIPSDYRTNFANQFTVELTKQLRREDLSIGDRTIYTENSYNLFASNFADFPFDKETIELTKVTVEAIFTILKDSSSLEVMFRHLVNNKMGLGFMHAQLCTFVCRHILKHMKWWTPELIKKLCMVAFFHDLLLNQEKLLPIRTEEQLKKAGFTPDEETLINKHAYLMSESLKKLPHIPMDVEGIIKQHHGSFSGIGFVEKYPGNLLQMANIFIIAEEFTHHLINLYPKNFDQKTIIAMMGSNFDHPKFSPLIEALKTIEI